MGKRSNFERLPRDFYKTPLAAVMPLAPFLPSIFSYIEPCAGDGRLLQHIEELCPHSYCEMAMDIEPDPVLFAPDIHIVQGDALKIVPTDFDNHIDFVITNPPWSRDKRSGHLLHRMIETFVEIAPTWLLFDADWKHTVQARPLITNYLAAVVSIGRVKWIEGSTMTGKDNCCWYLFDKDARTKSPVPVFHGRNIIPAM